MEFSKCYTYGVNWTQLLDSIEYTDESALTLEPNNSWPLVKCSHGWEYNTTSVWSSIVIDVIKETIHSYNKSTSRPI